MLPNPPRRFLIVGSGIAGSLLAWELLRLGAEITVCRDKINPGSSPVAAGLITPITGLRFVKSWNLDRVFPQALTTYQELETLSGNQVFQALPILRLFKNDAEAVRWSRKTDSEDLQKFISAEWNQAPSVPGILHHGGGLEIRGGGWVHVPALVESLENLMKNRVRYFDQAMVYEDLKVSKLTAWWQGEEFDRVLFCQGYRPENPWFDWLEWKAAQGEILTLHIPEFPQDRIINRGLFILPLGNSFFRCGATYNWNYLQPKPSAKGRSQLETELRQLISLHFKVVDHNAAVRPILKHPFPLLGLHPRFSVLGIFNGLGSKGTLTAPYYARHFANHLVAGELLDPEIHVGRNL